MEVKSQATLLRFLKSLTVGGRTDKDGLSVFSLKSNIKSVYEYITLDEAIAKNTLVVEEMGSAIVPLIRVVNTGKEDVFIMDGEELVGAKQNRIVNISLMVPKESTISIPVSCVEEGRWRHTSDKFYSSPNISYATLRKTQKDSVVESMKTRDSFQANQQKVWNNVCHRMVTTKTNSPTSAMSDIYEKEKPRIEEYRDAFPIREGQIGAVFAINGEIFGMDVFDIESTCKKIMPKIIRSYVLEILSKEKVKKNIKIGQIETFLSDIVESGFEAKKSPGKGMNVSITGRRGNGTALVVVEDTVGHTSIFAKSGPEKPKTPEVLSRISYPSIRRYRQTNE